MPRNRRGGRGPSSRKKDPCARSAAAAVGVGQDQPDPPVAAHRLGHVVRRRPGGGRGEEAAGRARRRRQQAQAQGRVAGVVGVGALVVVDLEQEHVVGLQGRLDGGDGLAPLVLDRVGEVGGLRDRPSRGASTTPGGAGRSARGQRRAGRRPRAGKTGSRPGRRSGSCRAAPTAPRSERAGRSGAVSQSSSRPQPPPPRRAPRRPAHEQPG